VVAEVVGLVGVAVVLVAAALRGDGSHENQSFNKAFDFPWS